MSEDIFKKVVSHAKEYGFIFQSSEIYDGLSAVYDYGQNGAELKNNIKQYWWKAMVQMHENIVGIDSAIFMHPTTWKASGHVDAFNDPLIDNKDSKKRYRADVLIEDHCAKIEGKSQLQGAQVKATDLRAAAALILAGLVADGTTQVTELKHLDRGYVDLHGKLEALGADIKRTQA